MPEEAMKLLELNLELTAFVLAIQIMRLWRFNSIRLEAGETKRLDISLGLIVGNLHGDITDARTEAPIAGARVELLGFAYTTTGSTGYYEIDDVPFGIYTLKVSHPDYEDYSLEVTMSKTTQRQDISLYPKPGAADFTFVATDSTTGEPIAGMSIELYDISHCPTCPVLSDLSKPAGSCITDASGRCSISVTAPGVFDFLATHPDYGDYTGRYSIEVGETIEVSIATTPIEYEMGLVSCEWTTPVPYGGSTTINIKFRFGPFPFPDYTGQQEIHIFLGVPLHFAGDLFEWHPMSCCCYSHTWEGMEGKGEPLEEGKLYEFTVEAVMEYWPIVDGWSGVPEPIPRGIYPMEIQIAKVELDPTQPVYGQGCRGTGRTIPAWKKYLGDIEIV